MHDLATIQRMNAEAVAKHGEKKWELAVLLDEMLYQWDNFEVGEFDAFLMAWVERLTR